MRYAVSPMGKVFWWFLLFTLAIPPLMGWAQGGDQTLLADLSAQLIPQSGSKTSYGIPFSLENAQYFADWVYNIQLAPEERAVVERVLASIPAPCCDDNSVLACCCSKDGKTCNLTRSAQGLAAFLSHEKGFSAAEIEEAVIQWLRFLHPNFYLAVALEERDLDPQDFGLKGHDDYESCYQGLCEAPIDQGGCGGMGLDVKVGSPKSGSCCK